MIKISVIVPVYNTEKYLIQCFESLIAQTYQNIEFIIINDGSTDNSLEIINEYAQKYPKFKIINQENKGYSGARNSALKAADGDYIGFVDSDDYIAPDMYKIMAETAEKKDADIVSSGFWRFYENKNGKTVRKKDSNELYVNVLNENHQRNYEKIILDYGELLLDHAFVWNRIYRKKMIEENNIVFPNDIEFGEDIYFHKSALLYSKNISYIPEELYFYRQERLGAQTTLNDKRNMSFLKICQKLYDYADNNNLNMLYPWLNHLTLSLCSLGYERIDKKWKKEYYNNFKEIINSRPKPYRINYPNYKKAGYINKSRYSLLKMLHPILYFSLRNNNKILFDSIINIRILLQNIQRKL